MLSVFRALAFSAVAAALAAGVLLPPADATGQVLLKTNPYAGVDWERTGRYMANLHTHTTQSDGRMPPAEVIGHYHQRGYHILAITDHDRCTWPWQEFGADPAELGMIPIAGNELSRHHHTLSLFCTLATQTRDLDTAIAEVAEAGGVAVLAHPAMHWPREQRRVPGLQVELAAALRRIAQADFTVEAWFRTTDAGRNILMGNFAGGRGGALNLELHTGNRVRVYLAPVEGGRTVDLNVDASTLAIDTRDGRWHHLAAVRQGQTVRMYLDGRLAGEAPDTAGAFDLLGDLYHLGRDTRTDSTTFEGDLDHVRLWQRALSAEELAAVFRGDVPAKPSGPSTKGMLTQYTFEHPDDTPAEAGAAVAGPVADTGGHPAGPFPAAVTQQGAPVVATDVPKPLKRSSASRTALRFTTAQDDVKGVPENVAERYAEMFRTREHLIGMEVLNGTRPLSEYALDRELWDKLLVRLMPGRPVWGFSTDDMHSMAHLGRDWIVVLAPALDEPPVRDAICRGAFFSATIRLHDADIESLFQEFIPFQLEVLPQYCNVVPGVVEAVDSLRSQGMAIGATTGYNAEMMQLCMKAAARAGYRPDVSVAVTEVPAGRPAPWMALKAAVHLGVYPWEAMVKVGDTPVDVEEGLNAGMWTVAVVESGNEMGLSEADLAALPPAVREQRRRRAWETLARAGAHYVIDRIAQLSDVVAEINARLAQGEKP